MEFTTKRNSQCTRLAHKLTAQYAMSVTKHVPVADKRKRPNTPRITHAGILYAICFFSPIIAMAHLRHIATVIATHHSSYIVDPHTHANICMSAVAHKLQTNANLANGRNPGLK